jgi:hypothetical protein
VSGRANEFVSDELDEIRDRLALGQMETDDEDLLHRLEELGSDFGNHIDVDDLIERIAELKKEEREAIESDPNQPTLFEALAEIQGTRRHTARTRQSTPGEIFDRL